MIPVEPSLRVLHQFQHLVGLFGSRGWPSVSIVQDDGTTREFPLPEREASRVQYCRKILSEFGREPITP